MLKLFRPLLKWLLDQCDVHFSHDDGLITAQISFAGKVLLNWKYRIPL